jgi:AraC-like DNA-binding protein
MNVVGAVDLNKTGGFTTTRFPRHQLLQVAPSAEMQLARPLGHDRALSMMIERYTALCKELAGELDPLGQKTAMHHLTDLVGHFVETTGGPKKPAGQLDLSMARLDLVKAEILEKLDRADLTIEAVAKANGLTTRQAQRMFASSGTTFTDFVLEQRLLLSRRLLLQQSARHRKISDIAFTVGFNDLSYFHRSFKKRFGFTPSDIQVG